MALSPDGTTLALATLSPAGSALVALWELASLTPVGEPLRPSHPVSSLAFSPDSATLAVGSEDASVTVWDAASQQPLSESMAGHAGPVTGLAFAPDGVTLASQRARTPSRSSGTYRRRGRTLRPSLCPSPSSRISPSAPTARSSRRQPACPRSRPIRTPGRLRRFGSGTRLRASPSERRSRAAPRSRSSHSAMTAECSRARPRTTRSSCRTLRTARTEGRPLREEGASIRVLDSAPTVRFWRRPSVSQKQERGPGRTPSTSAIRKSGSGPRQLRPRRRAVREGRRTRRLRPGGEEVSSSPRGPFPLGGRRSPTGAGGCRARGERVRAQPRRKAAGDVRRRRRDPLEPRERLGPRQRQPSR